MAYFRCKMCGGSLEIADRQSVITCEYCGTQQTLPRLDDDRRANMYDRANHFRRNNEFDKAMGVYEQILNEDTTDAEAYWSLVLCKYGIEYVEDPDSHQRIPTVNRAQFTSIFDDENYLSALKHSDALQRGIYEREAATINEIQKGILEISQKEEPFDVFICYKESDNRGQRTVDSVLAEDIYEQLTKRNLKVFFARITLEDKLGSAYEPYIFAALNSAKVMIVVGTRAEHFEAVWVKNEWSRFLSLVNQSRGDKLLIPAYKDVDPYNLPKEFAHLQAQDMNKIGFMQDLVRGIKKVIGEGNDAPAITTAALLERMNGYLEDGDWDNAEEYAERVLDMDIKCVDAHVGELMAELKVKKRSDLANLSEPFEDNKNYKKAIRYANDEELAELKGYVKAINDRIAEQAEKARLERERKAEQARIEEEIKKKKLKKLAFASVIALPVIFLLVIFVIHPGINYLNGNYAPFIRMYNVKEFTVPDGVDEIESNAFIECDSLERVVIPDSVTLISYGAFRNCDNLKNIDIPEGVTHIGDFAFSNCRSIESITIPNGVEFIGDSVFFACSSLESVELSDGITSIGPDAFCGCGSLKSITLPESVRSIGDSAFEECMALQSIVLPEDIQTIGESAFDGCSSLKSITFTGKVPEYSYRSIPGLTKVVFTEDVYEIPAGAFRGCEKLKTVDIAYGVCEIGSTAFKDCDALLKIVIPKSVYSMGEGVFDNCEFLVIYCASTGKPTGWDSDWNGGRLVYWGYTGE